MFDRKREFGRKGFVETVVPWFIGFVFVMVFVIIVAQIGVIIYGVTHLDTIGHTIGHFFGSIADGAKGR